MGQSLERAASQLPRKSPARASLRGESDCRNLAPVEIRKAIARTFAIAELLNEDLNRTAAAMEMGYADAAIITKWISGAEPPNYARILSVERLRIPFAMALQMADKSVGLAVTNRAVTA